MPREIGDSVVVVTGASSGIGRATSVAFARRGAAVVLTARRIDVLEEVARECEAAGGRALAVTTDVTDEGAVNELARRAIDEFGRIDTWVNNAGVYLLARFGQAPPELFRRVLDVNLFGCVHGARAVLPYFRCQGSGVLINVSSVDGRIGSPYLSAYTASKWALRGFSESLRQELRGSKIHVCVVLPASIDTPLFTHAANYTGRAVKPISPANRPELVAEAIVELAKRPRRERLVGLGGQATSIGHTLMPRLAERIYAAFVERSHFADEWAADTPGNLLEPMAAGRRASGGFNGTRLSVGRLALVTSAIAVPALVAGVRSRR